MILALSRFAGRGSTGKGGSGGSRSGSIARGDHACVDIDRARPDLAQQAVTFGRLREPLNLVHHVP